MRPKVSSVLSFLSDRAIHILSKYPGSLDDAEEGVIDARHGRRWQPGRVPRDIVVAVNAIPIAMRLEGYPSTSPKAEDIPWPIEVIQVNFDRNDIYLEVYPGEVVYQMVYDGAALQQLKGVLTGDLGNRRY